jgi:AcrR family transcriptional regulator
MTGLRERNKEKRREAILDATLALLRTEPLGAVTTERVAALAEVAPATVYNLVGPRDQLLGALVQRVLDGLVDTLQRLDPAVEADPIGAARIIVEQSARAFIADAAAFRQILGVVPEVVSVRDESAFDPAQLQVAALRHARDVGVLRREFDPRALGRQVYLSYVGAMFSWARGALDDDGFLLGAHHGLLTVVAATATDEHRDRYLRELRTLSNRLARTGPRGS